MANGFEIRDRILSGRDQQLIQARRVFESAAAGKAEALLVHGEPGIGKTTFLTAVAVEIASCGATVLRGEASAATGMPPYLPFLEALGSYIQRVPIDRLSDETTGIGFTLTSLFPELFERLDVLEPSYPLPPEQARLRLFEAMGSFLAAIAKSAPLVLVLDDLQWVDRSTLDLLAYILQHAGDTRLLILGAYRMGDAAQNTALAWALVELNRLRLLTTIVLESLDEEAVALLAANYLGSPASTEVSRLLYEHSEGNPFFAEELLREWIENGSVAQEEGKWTLVFPLQSTLPESLASAIRLRVSKLSPAAKIHLQMASIIGRSFDSELLATIVNDLAEQVDSSLIETTRAGLIRTTPSGRYTFTHDKIRETLYGQIGKLQLKRIHQSIAAVLEGQPGPRNMERLSVLAFHFSRAELREKGAYYSEVAGERALRSYAAEEAQVYFQNALGQLYSEDNRRGKLLMKLGLASLLAGREVEAADAFESSRYWFVEHDDVLAAARAAYHLGRVMWRLEDHESAQTIYQDMLLYLGSRKEPETVEILLGLSEVLGVSLHQYAQALSLSREALKIADRLHEGRLAARARRVVGTMLVRSNLLSEGISLLEQALSWAKSQDDPTESAECCAHLLLAYVWNSRTQDALRLSRTWESLAQRCHDPFQLRHCYSISAVINGALGQWSRAADLVALALPIVVSMTSPEPKAFLNYCQGVIATQYGDYEEAESRLIEAVEGFRSVGPDSLVWYLGFLGVSQAIQGKRRDALANIAEVERLVLQLPVGTTPTAEPLSQMAVIALALQNRDLLTRLYSQLKPFRGQFHDFLVDRLLGSIEAARGEWVRAWESLTVAEKTARQESLKLELVYTLQAQADLTLSQGGPGSAMKARRLLGEALDLSSDLGHLSAQRLLKKQLRSLPSQPGEMPVKPLPAHLSARQAEVLRLVAQGKSNRQIAHELFLSEKTVANHLTAIFNKIAVDNRAAAAAFAVQHNLI